MSDGLDPRRAAARTFSQVLKQKRPLETVLAGQAGYAGMSGPDRGFARTIAATSLRRYGQAEIILNHFLSKPLAETSEGARALLVTGAVQMLWLDTPPHAAVSAAVSLAEERADTRKLKGLVNAVLRKIAREGSAQLARTTARDNLQPWMRDSWRKAYGPARLGRIADAAMRTPPLDLTLRDPSEAGLWAGRLDARILPTGSLRRDTIGDITALPGFDTGAWWAQDAAAALPARVLAARKGEHVVDMCAAPGGKTLQLAASGARVTALDISDKRLDRLRENLERTGLEARVLATDGRGWTPKRPVDAVLLDAPCTATGTMRRHPEAAWIKQESDVAALGELQMALTRSAVKMLKPGGRLILCTCSLQPEEGEDLARQILRRHRNLSLDPVAPEEVTGLDGLVNSDGQIRTTPADWPDEGGLDGFFIARFRLSA